MSTTEWTTSRLLSTAARLNDHHQNQRLRQLGITHAGLTVLRALTVSGPVSQVSLAGLVRIQAQTMGKILEKLEVSALVLRARDTWDGRTLRCRITSEGQSVLERVDQVEHDPADTAGLSSPELRQALITIIATLGVTPASTNAPAPVSPSAGTTVSHLHHRC